MTTGVLMRGVVSIRHDSVNMPAFGDRNVTGTRLVSPGNMEPREKRNQDLGTFQKKISYANEKMYLV